MRLLNTTHRGNVREGHIESQDFHPCLRLIDPLLLVMYVEITWEAWNSTSTQH